MVTCGRGTGLPQNRVSRVGKRLKRPGFSHPPVPSDLCPWDMAFRLLRG